MNLEKLPWWKDNTSYKNAEFLRHVLENTLLKRIREFPLTEDLINSFLEKYVFKVRVYDFGHNFYKARIYRVGSLKFEIMVHSEYFLEEKASFFIHECAHGIYRVQGENIESILEKCHEDFYKKNKLFCINLFEESVKSKR